MQQIIQKENREMRGIRVAQPEQLEEIMGIYAYAQKFMAEHGNPTQWETIYPPRDLVEENIHQKKCYVCMDKSSCRERV